MLRDRAIDDLGSVMPADPDRIEIHIRCPPPVRVMSGERSMPSVPAMRSTGGGSELATT
jgi:hypothetical protein